MPALWIECGFQRDAAARPVSNVPADFFQRGLDAHQGGDARQPYEPIRITLQQADEIHIVSTAAFTDRDNGLSHASLIHLFEQRFQRKSFGTL